MYLNSCLAMSYTGQTADFGLSFLVLLCVAEKGIFVMSTITRIIYTTANPRNAIKANLWREPQ